MQISGFSSPSILPAQHRRVDVVERQQRDVQREATRSEDKRLDTLRNQGDESAQPRVESANRNHEVNSRRQAEAQSLPLRTQQALQTFADNTPSPEQRLGIELAGIDTFA